MSIGDIISLVGVLVAIVALVITIVIYMKEMKRTKRVETHREINELFDFYHNMNDKKNYQERVHFMSKIDRFAVPVNEKLFDIEIVKRRASKFLIDQYNDYMKEYIEQRRKQFKDDKYYENIEELISKLK